MTTFDRYARVAAEVAACAQDCGRAPESVRLIAVSKTVGPDQVELAAQAGAQDFGENRPDQIGAKQPQFPQARWHFIGNIQSRQIPNIVPHAALIHSVCKLSHAEKISQVAQGLGKVQDILLEVNVSGELSKSGFAPEEVPEVLAQAAALPAVRVRGFMTMAPQGSAATARKTFHDLAKLFATCKTQLTPEAQGTFTELSMGMSEDWREAIAEGATMVRVGRAIFSDSFDQQ